MSSAFLGLEVARTGLKISQRSMDIVGKNIANANTQGYSRQRVVSTPAANNMGVEFVSVEQIRDKFLDSQYQTEVSSLGEWDIKSTALTDLETYMQEPSENGLSTAVSDFFTATQQASLQPESEDLRTVVSQDAVKLTDTLNYLYDRMVTMQQNYSTQAETAVTQVNTIAQNIQLLNTQISKITTNSESVNELKDQRNTLVNDLSKLVKVTTSEDSNGTFSVMIGGEYLVNGSTVNKLTTAKDISNPIVGEANIPTIKWESTGNEVSVDGGNLKGYMDILKGNGKSSTDNPKTFGIPYFVNKLNTFAGSIATAINDIQKQGYTIPNETNGNTSVLGKDFFATTDGATEFTAKNISVSSDIINNVYNIAASDAVVTDYNKGNNGNIKKLSDLGSSLNVNVTVGGNSVNVGSFSGYVTSLVTEMASESSYNQQMKDTQDSISQSIETKINSISGVSLDEEMANMIQFQHSYSAAAKVITTVNEMLDTLIRM